MFALFAIPFLVMLWLLASWALCRALETMRGRPNTTPRAQEQRIRYRRHSGHWAGPDSVDSD